MTKEHIIRQIQKRNLICEIQKKILFANTKENLEKVKVAVAEFMVENVLTQEEILGYAMAHLQQTYNKHTIGDLAALVKGTDIPKPHPQSPSQPNRILCHGIIKGDYYFFTKEQDYEYSALEVTETTTITTKEVQ